MNPSTIIHDFEGEPLLTFHWQGRPCWVARHIAMRIGYKNGGKRLPNKILTDWAGEFIEGHDYTLLVGDELAAFNRDLPPDSDGPVGRGSLCLLFEPGVFLVLAKTELPAGKRLRRFLVDEVLPQVARRGTYAPKPGPASQEEIDSILLLFPEFKPRPIRTPSLNARREARLELQARVRSAWVDYCARRLKVSAVHRLIDGIGEQLDPSVRAALEILAAELATDMAVGDVVFPPDDDPAPADALHQAA